MSDPSNSTLSDKPTKTLPFLDEDGVYRVKRLYREILNGEESGEAGFIWKTWYHSMIAGGIIGATIGMRPVYNDFKTRFNEYQFQSKTAYARKLADCTLSTCIRNGFKFGWRAGLLALLFSTTTINLAVYHNDIRFTDMVFSFALTGGVYTFHRGPKAMLAGATLTGLAGIPVAGLFKGLLWATDSTYAELSDKARSLYDAPYIKRMKKIQNTEQKWREASVEYIDDYKSYIYHQRRVDRFEKMGIVDESFENLKPGEARPPASFK